MRTTLILALAAALLAGAPSGAAAQDCANPIAGPAFQGAFNQIAAQQSNQRKLDRALQLLDGTCLTAAQVKSVAVLFTEDSYRYDFCEAAYLHTFDRVNFYDVYDTFAAVSFAFRLHDRVAVLRRGGGGGPREVPPPPPPPPPADPDPTFPNLPYPSLAGYGGPRGCEGPVASDEAFRQVARNVARQPTDESKLVAIQGGAEQCCLGFGQLMRLASLVASEPLRLQALKSALSRVYDLGNFGAGAALFSSSALQNDWIAYGRAVLAPPAPPPPPPPPPCLVSAADFASIMKEFNDRRFPDEKLSMLKAISGSRCFNVEQIRTISQQFAFGEQKLTVFKSLRAKCPDGKNYYKLVGELTFSSEKDELTKFIQSTGGS